ncbi:MAG TPA: flagellar biosynthetic protein FliR [Sandaracinaceae bacterium LLY-WYZ-13_1]|nr:flagellar biosynthetic protein FliR [Sandaracinaceae bacterium LLY-WYZ-13_1]
MQSLLEDLLPFLPFLFLVFLRVGILIASLPAPFGSGAPVQVRVALALFVTLAVCGPHWSDAPAIPLEALPLGRAALGELLVGAVIGLTVRVTLAAAEVAGNLAGLSMGQGFAATVDPTFGEQMLPVARVLSALAVLIFFALSGHHVTLRALAASLRLAPVGDSLSHAVHAGTVEIGAGLLAQGLRIASPVVGTMFLVQIGMGLIARSAPRVQIFSLTFAITSAVGGVVLFAAMPSVAAALAETLRELPTLLRSALGGR